MKVDDAACPSCSAPAGSLTIADELVVKPLGTFSIAGAQMKVTAATLPVLNCSACGLSVIGRYDADGRHVEFPQPITDKEQVDG